MTMLRSKIVRGLALAALVVSVGGAARALAQSSSAPSLAGTWSSSDWGVIELRADGTGTYSSTYGTGAGRLVLRAIGQGRFAGTWGESPQRHGTLLVSLSPDGRTITGHWSPDPDCTIGTMVGDELRWTRQGPARL
ncbi:MAG: hypothetical protein K1X94_08585 [Sandaracinaceae bacterium]|nr:hypothetical protein [Sandaracinaceae bacterium]